METIYYTVLEICGDYVRLRSEQGVEKEMAIFLLPEGVTDGSRIKFENFSYEIVE